MGSCFTENKQKKQNPDNIEKKIKINQQKIIIPNIKIKLENDKNQNESINEQNSSFISNKKSCIYNIINPDYSKLDNFMKQNQIQDSFFKNEQNDEVFEELKKLEKENLIKEFESEANNYKNNFLNKEKLNLSIDNNLISDIIEKENSKRIFKNKIINEVNNINQDINKYEIKHLTILLVGRKIIGKTTLIKYILKLEDDEIKNINQNEDFIEYKSNKITHLKLIEFKGMGYDKNSEPQIIGQKTMDFIQKRNNSDSYNDFIHCIWYCVSGTRVEELERQVLAKLKGAYKNNVMPIIIVHTQTIDGDVADGIKEYIENFNLENEFVKVNSKDVILENDGGIFPAFGEKELLNLTLKKCTEALGGQMINIMIDKISKDIKEYLTKQNEENENDIKENIISDFIEKYENILDDQSFLDYIIKIIGRDLNKYYDKKIYNASLNILIKSKIIENIKELIYKYKEKTKEIIKPKIFELANIFIDLQARKEKDCCINIKIENKRDLKGFIKTNKEFLENNFYFISQKYIINYLIKEFCGSYFIEFRKKFDSFINDLLIENVDNDIRNLLLNCFTLKLINFANNNKIEANIKVENINKKLKKDLPDKNELDDEMLERHIINSNNNANDLNIDEQKNESIEIKNRDNETWFPLIQKNFKYLKNDIIESLNIFLQTTEIQDSFFNVNSMDRVFNKLKEYIKKDLENFFILKKKEFIVELDKKHKQNILKSKDIPIEQVLENENALLLYNNKIKEQFDKIKADTNLVKIKHLSIIVIGKSGVGKSTLINAILKLKGDKKAGEYIGRIGTENDKAYTDDRISFLRIIDTRGIELDKKYGPKKILEKTKEIINKQNIKNNIQNNEYNPKENNYNDYVHCIWYCVSNSGIDQQEIEIIKLLNNKQNALPLIVVFTNAQNKEKTEETKNFIKKEVGNIQFMKVLAKPIKVLKSFGIEELIIKTVDICKNAIKSEMFYTIKEIVSDNITKIFKEKNEEIKNNVNKDMVLKFTKNYKIENLDDNHFFKFIYDLLEIIFIGYLKINKEEKKLNFQSKNCLQNIKSLNNSINEYIKFYKKNAKIFINGISSQKALNYLDEQAKKEIREFKFNIKIENKNDKKDFIKIIESFLNSNFYFISQKYIIYRLITDVSESFSEEVEKKVNQMVSEILKSNDADNWLKNIYYQKIEDLREIINQFCKNGEYKENNITCNNLEYKKTINNNNSNKEITDVPNCECPIGPYPIFGTKII